MPDPNITHVNICTSCRRDRSSHTEPMEVEQAVSRHLPTSLVDAYNRTGDEVIGFAVTV